MGKKAVYILLTDTGTLFSRMIKFYTVPIYAFPLLWTKNWINCTVLEERCAAIISAGLFTSG